MTIETTLKERGDRYGDFAHHAKIAQDLQDVARATEGWARLDAAQRQALTVICDKIARILSGDPNYADNWHDIQGYAKLVEDRLPGDGPSPDALPVSDSLKQALATHPLLKDTPDTVHVKLPVLDKRWREEIAFPGVQWSRVRDWVRDLKDHDVVRPSDLNEAEREYLLLKGRNV